MIYGLMMHAFETFLYQFGAYFDAGGGQGGLVGGSVQGTTPRNHKVLIDSGREFISPMTSL